MRERTYMAFGIVLMALSALSLWLRLGQVPVHVYLPDTPLTNKVEALLGDQPAGPPSLTAMRLRIPAIGVDASVENLGLMQDGTMETPRRWEDVGWYSGSPLPGESGVSVISGHVDSHTGTAVFYRLHELQPGNSIVVSRDGRTAVFDVLSIRSYPEDSVPRQELLSSAGPPRLALLTCAGDFNRLTQRYNDRLLVLARLAPAGQHASA